MTCISAGLKEKILNSEHSTYSTVVKTNKDKLTEPLCADAWHHPLDQFV